MSDDWYDCGDDGYAKAGDLELEASARIRAHDVFDALWENAPAETEKRFARKKAYAWLAFRLNIKWDACHMAQFDEHTCRRVITICRRATFADVLAWWAGNHGKAI